MGRLIRKYPNRRLYDTQASCYVTLADVKQLVIDNENFTVIDSKTTQDITRSVLLQILLEEENTNEPIFSSEFIKVMIRCYGMSMQHLFYAYLEKNMKNFLASHNHPMSGGGKHQGPDSPDSANKPWPDVWGFPFFQKMMKDYINQTNNMFDHVQKAWKGPFAESDNTSDIPKKETE